MLRMPDPVLFTPPAAPVSRPLSVAAVPAVVELTATFRTDAPRSIALRKLMELVAAVSFKTKVVGLNVVPAAPQLSAVGEAIVPKAIVWLPAVKLVKPLAPPVISIAPAVAPSGRAK